MSTTKLVLLEKMLVNGCCLGDGVPRVVLPVDMKALGPQSSG